MREDPIISGGLFKLLLLVLVAAGLGIGALAILGNGVDIDLPDLPEVDSGQVMNSAGLTSPAAQPERSSTSCWIFA